VLLKSRTNLTKATPLYNFLHPWLGLGLLTRYCFHIFNVSQHLKVYSTGQQWFEQRKLLTPAFHFEILQHFVPIFQEHGTALVKYIEKRLHEGFVDIRLPITLSTLDIICGNGGC
jgi:cytochrome P450 family 4